MLSDHERRTLRELDGRFLADDPEFPRSFDARAQRLGHTPLGGSATLALAVGVLLCVLMLVAGSLAGALAFAAATGAIWLAWRHSTGSRRQPP